MPADKDQAMVAGNFPRRIADHPLDAGEDAAMGVAASARPLFIAARFARAPKPTLVVCPGEEAAAAFVRNLVMELGFVFLLPALFGPDGIWFAVDAAELCCLLMNAALIIAFRKRYGY